MAEKILDWIIEQRQSESAVSTLDIIDKTVSLRPNFKEGDEKKRQYWMYDLMKRRNLSVWTRTRTSQILNAAMQLVKDAYCHRIMTSYNLRINNPKYLLNIDETAVYLKCSPKRTMYLKGENIVSVMIGGSSSMRFTLTVTVAMDRTKLPLFVIFKGKQVGTVEKQLTTFYQVVYMVAFRRKHGWTKIQCLSGIIRSINLILEITMDILDYYWTTSNATKAMNCVLKCTMIMQCVL